MVPKAQNEESLELMSELLSALVCMWYVEVPGYRDNPQGVNLQLQRMSPHRQVLRVEGPTIPASVPSDCRAGSPWDAAKSNSRACVILS